MYTTIGFLSPKIAIQKIQDNLKDLHSDSSSQESSDNTILDTDTVIYAIKNTEEMSYIEFHVKTLENNLFIHHDIFVTDTIIAADYLESNGKHILVTGGCEKNVNLYDCFIDNIFDPLFTFKGHDSEINAIIASNYGILSGGDDCKIFKWDMDTQKQKEMIQKKFIIRKMIDFENNFICADVDKIYFDEKEICNKVEITDLKILENKIYFSDVEGYLNMIDLRKFEILKKEKIHEDALNAFEFINENVVSVSLDENIIWSSIEDFKFEKKQKTQGENYSIKYDKNSQTCLYGGSEEILKILI